MKYVNYNGELFNQNQPFLSVDNRAFKYGDGLFETIKIVDGLPVFVQQHLQRLHVGMKWLGIIPNAAFDADYVRNEIIRTARRSRLNGGGVARLSVFRKTGGKYTATDHHFDFTIELEESVNGFVLNTTGINTGVYDKNVKPLHPLGQIKSANSLLYVLAANYGATQGWDETILLNEHGHLCEGASSNIFMVIKGKLATPSIQSQGCLPGTMRLRVLEIAQELGMEVYQTSLSPDALEMASEVFFTNAVQGVKWVLGHHGKRYYSKVSSQIIEELNKRTAKELDYIKQLYIQND